MSAWWLPDAVTVDSGSVIARASQLPSRTSAMKDATARPVSALEVIVRAGSIHAVIGDVAGHGPDEAAIGAALRIAWRALTLAGFEDAKAMHQLDRMLCAERGANKTFATGMSLTLKPEHAAVTTVRAGHPGVLLHNANDAWWADPHTGPTLEVHPDRVAPGSGTPRASVGVI